jgi:murein L,D-transpeptidase YcbB/YkuD
MKHGSIIAFIFVIIVIFHSPAVALESTAALESKALQAWMARLSATDAKGQNLYSAVARFYQQVGYHPVWTGPDGLLPDGEMLLQTITQASTAGCDLENYLLPGPSNAWIDYTQASDPGFPKAMASYLRSDVMLTEKILRYAYHVYQGSVMPEQIYQSWLAPKRPTSRDIPVALAQSVRDDCLSAFIESLHPRSEAYKRLRNALLQYEIIRRSGGWFPIDKGPTLRIGDKGPRVAMLKYRLKLTADGFEDAPIENDRFDKNLASAVKHFQHRHGLEEDSLVGKETLAELNVPVEKRIDQLQLSMERWRWYPDSLGDRFLMVNIPAFTLTVVESGSRVDRIPVIVGKKNRQTPIMSDQMTYIEFNPYWNIPQKITRKDILPKIKHDPAYLINQGIRVFDSWDQHAQALDPTGIDWNSVSADYFPYRLRQDPSRLNALGQIKFMFPNPKSIYIHDTPGKSLFSRQQRTFSSGCVRIETPFTLAFELLNDQGWNLDRLKTVTGREKPVSVVLKEPIPVHLVYFTAWVDEDQTVNFRKDIYGHDARLLQALHHPEPAHQL